MENQDSEKLKNATIESPSNNCHNNKEEFTSNELVENNNDESEISEMDKTTDEPVSEAISELGGVSGENSFIINVGEQSSISENCAIITGPADAVVENGELPVAKKSFQKTFLGRLLFYILFAVVVYFSIFVFPSGLQTIAVSTSLMSASNLTNSESEMADSKAKLESKIAELDKQLESYVPNKPYIVVSTIDNEFTLMKGNDVVRKGKCSTGSLVKLEDDKRGRSYFFQTPKGLRNVLKKKKDPVWTRPDWAYIDDGLPIPSGSDPSRIEEGVLGDYALELGNGYMIHGTLWQRYLGLPVTHGCIRLNDADLEVVFNTLEKGSNVYIY